MSAIVLDKITKKFGAFEVVKNISFSVAPGTTMGLIGCNGAGKTTTIAMIMGLITPTTGSISILGHNMATRPLHILNKMNFQSPYIGMPAQLSVWQNLHIFGKLYNIPKLKQRIDELIAEFALSEVAHRQTSLLSAGQKTRVSLAKALLNKPEILLLDEPTASLDPERANWVRNHLLSYQKKYHTTILLSSHNMSEIQALCDFVAIMSYGHIVASGSAEHMVKRMFGNSENYSNYDDYNYEPLEASF